MENSTSTSDENATTEQSEIEAAGVETEESLLVNSDNEENTDASLEGVATDDEVLASEEEADGENSLLINNSDSNESDGVIVVDETSSDEEAIAADDDATEFNLDDAEYGTTVEGSEVEITEATANVVSLSATLSDAAQASAVQEQITQNGITLPQVLAQAVYPVPLG